MILAILGLLFIAYLLGVEPYLRHRARKSFYFKYQNDENARAVMYRNDFIRNLLIGFFTIAIAWSCSITKEDLTLIYPDISQFYLTPLWIQFIFVGIFAWFVFYYFIFVTFGVRLHSKFRTYLIKKIKPVAVFAPQSLKEYIWWTVNAFGSFFEELAYRGFFFFFVQHFLPFLSIWIVGVLSIFLESVRYAPRLAAMQYVAQRSLVFVLAFIVFHSLYVAIFLHIVYNLRIMAVPFHWARENNATT